MDYQSRVTKVETLVDTIRQDMDRLHAADDELRKLILERTDRLDEKIDSGFKDLDEKIDSGLKDLDEKVDRGLKDLDEKIDRGLKDLDEKIDRGLKDLDEKIECVRKEGVTHFRWTIAMFFTILALIGGLYGKLFGLY